MAWRRQKSSGPPEMETMAWISESPLPSDLRFSDTPVKSNASALSLMVA